MSHVPKVPWIFAAALDLLLRPADPATKTRPMTEDVRSDRPGMFGLLIALSFD